MGCRNTYPDLFFFWVVLVVITYKNKSACSDMGRKCQDPTPQCLFVPLWEKLLAGKLYHETVLELGSKALKLSFPRCATDSAITIVPFWSLPLLNQGQREQDAQDRVSSGF